MTDEALFPIAKQPKKSVPVGRRADALAAALAGLGALLALVSAVWFFAGFAENDTRPEHLASALVLTLILFSFAVVPFGSVFYFARQAHRAGTKRAHLFWTLFLMAPWILLGSLAATYTPLPIWCGLIMAGLALLSCIWAITSLILDYRHHPSHTTMSGEIETSDDLL